MGLIQRFKFASKVAELGPTRKDFQSGGWDGRNLNIWDRGHPLNTRAAFAGSDYSDRERIENDFESYVYDAYKSAGPVFSVITARQFVFSEAVFKFKNKATGKLHGNNSLALLENPWPGGTTGELLGRMEQDVSLAGNSWWTTANDQGKFGKAAMKSGTGQRLVRLRPDWVQIIIDSKSHDPRALDAKMVGVIYNPLYKQGGSGDANSKMILTADEIIHYSPIPDPAARFRGMSWLTPILREVEADKSATVHKGSFYDNAAVPNMAIKFAEETNREDIDEFIEKFSGSHQGKWQAYKTLFLMGGADVTPLSHDFKALDFTNVVGKGESRIASAAGVPPSWVGFSEGLQGSALNAGNMAANRRRFADGTIRPLWRIVCASLANIIDVPSDSVLWWDESGIAFLREDQMDRAEIMRVDANAVDAFIKAGFEPDAAVDAVNGNDITKLIGKHTGLVSVQMQPPVDPDNKLQEDQGIARILTTQMQGIQAAITAGFTHESAVQAFQSYDLSKLKKDPASETWSPSGQPLRVAADGTQLGAPPSTAPAAQKPPGAPQAPAQKPPAGKPPTTPEGGGNGQ